MDRGYSGLGEIRIGCISGSGKIWAAVIRFCGFRVDPTCLERIFGDLFFLSNKKCDIFIA